jgi:hypothetical protein
MLLIHKKKEKKKKNENNKKIKPLKFLNGNLLENGIHFMLVTELHFMYINFF